MNLIHPLHDLSGFHLKANPGMITPNQVIALGLCLAALAALRAGELLETAMKIFNLPTDRLSILSHETGYCFS
ncbi:hypothetical protein [Spirosoma arcticum]